MTIRQATSADVPAVLKLMESQRLPLDGVVDHVSTMVVAEDRHAVVGAAAVELYPDGGLLRSVVVNPVAQGQGLGQRLTEAALALAEACGATQAFLLTTTAERYFQKLGFVEISRDQVPDSVQRSVEFQSACPASATVMRKRLA